MTCPLMSRIFCPKIAIFPQFQVYSSITQAKQIINLLLLNNFYPVISTSSKRKQRIIIHGLVTRYGPQSAQLVNSNLLGKKSLHYTSSTIIAKKTMICIIERAEDFRETRYLAKKIQATTSPSILASPRSCICRGGQESSSIAPVNYNRENMAFRDIRRGSRFE